MYSLNVECFGWLTVWHCRTVRQRFGFFGSRGRHYSPQTKQCFWKSNAISDRLLLTAGALSDRWRAPCLFNDRFKWSQELYVLTQVLWQKRVYSGFSWILASKSLWQLSPRSLLLLMILKIRAWPISMRLFFFRAIKETFLRCHGWWFASERKNNRVSCKASERLARSKTGLLIWS